jgi:crotonobetainyl-CoA:carnitine CoA-transferase CaiB-like acyl-CoA transferase
MHAVDVDAIASGRHTALLPASIRVVELGDAVATGLTGRYLLRLGAQVTCVLPVGGPAETSELGPTIGIGESAGSAVAAWLHAGKDLVSADLAGAHGRTRLELLLGQADVVLIAGTSAEWNSYGASVPYIRSCAPTAVIGQISHWGDAGPYADLPGSELLVQAAGGLMNLVGVLEREPVRLGGHVMQATTGLLALDGVMIGLFRRSNTGQGAFFTTSVFEATAHLEWKIASQSQAGRRRELRGEDGGGPVVVRARDGYLALFFTPRNWPEVKQLIGDPRLDDQKFHDRQMRARHQSELAAVIEETTRSKSKRDLYHEAQALGIPAGYVATMSDLLQSPQARSRHFFQSVEVHGVGIGEIPDAPWQVLTPGTAPARAANV